MKSANTSSISRFIGAMVAHVILLVAVLVGTAFLAGNPATRIIVDSSWRYLIIPLPVIPVIYGVLVFVRACGDLDELQRRIQLEAFALALGATGILTFTYGYLELAGLPHINPIVILPLMAFLWGVGMVVAGRRYR